MNREREQLSDGRAAPKGQGRIASVSFLSFLTTQFLGAFNDNMFRWLAVPIGKDLVGKEYEDVALSAGLACLVLPFILLAAPAGYLADRFSKRTVIIGCKVAEVAIMLLGMVAIWSGNIYFLFAVIALMGSQSALFGPSKLGIIPDILHSTRISVGNGLVALTTVMAIVFGTVAGNYLYDYLRFDVSGNLWVSALALVGVAATGTATSLWIRYYQAADPQRRFPFNAPARMLHDLGLLARNPALLSVAVGIAFFWSLASLTQLNVDVLGRRELLLEQKDIGPMLAILSFGVGLGSVLAGVWSGGRVELGLVPPAALGIALSSMMLFTVPDVPDVPSPAAASGAYVWAIVWLGALGVFAGMFDVPLQAFMQHRSPAAVRGSILAANNVLTFSGMLLASAVFWVMRQPMGLSARGIFFFAGLLTLPVAFYALVLLPQATIRFVAWVATHTLYRVRVRGREHLPEEGGALLVANHVSWIDSILLLVTSSRPVRPLVHARMFRSWWARALMRLMGAIPVAPTAASTREALEHARQAILNGELVCVFPEGRLTRSGQLQGFRRRILRLASETSSPVIPVYLDELWGSIFSFRGGKILWKRPRRWPYPVSIWFGQPIGRDGDVRRVRQAVQDLGAEAVENRTTRSMLLPRRFLRQCRKKLFQPKVADSTKARLTGGQLLMRTVVLRRILAREVLAADERHVGVLLPPSAGGVVTNVALTLMQRVSCNLNYTASSETLNSCIRQASIRHVLTSRRFMEKMNFKLDAELVYLEDFKDKVRLSDKLAAVVCAYATPMTLLERIIGASAFKGDDVLTVIFTSGSTGEPKGVVLTHTNVLSNVEAIDQVVQLRSDDVIVGVLPFFHSFGYTVTLWSVLGLDVEGVYHFTPLDAKAVGKLCHEHRGTVLLATPTFLRNYVRRCNKEDFASLEVVVVGAEKMPLELADAFENKFGVRPVEGYGTTELSPLVSVNVPPSRSMGGDTGLKEGTVGRPVPGVSAKVVDPESYQDLPPGSEGMLLVKGPNVMLGYLDQPEKTAEVMHDGWYITGDIAHIDSDGFIKITGRQSRFSKIGGEMVPHIRVEEELNKAVGAAEDGLQLVVTSVPDERKGERLLVLYTELPQAPGELCRKLAEQGLPNLWIPSPDAFLQVDEIPVLGTGKLDLRGIQQLAEEKASAHARNAR